MDLFFGQIELDARIEAYEGMDGNGDSLTAPKVALLEEELAHLM